MQHPHVAAEFFDEAVEAVAYLIGLGVDPNAVTTKGETAMHGAAYAKFPGVVRYLDAHGAKIEVWNQPNAYSWTPLRIAEGHRFGCFKPSFETAAVLKEIMQARGVEIPPPVPRVEMQGY